MRRLHIAHFTNVYRPVTNGVVRSVTTFRRQLTEMGHNVFVFCQHAHGHEDSEPFIFRYPALELPLQQYPLTIPVSMFVDKLLPSLKLDVIHAHHPALLGQVAIDKARALDVPMVFTYHTRYRDYSHYIALPQELVKDVIDRWVGDFLQHCHHVVVPSESIRRMVARIYGVEDGVTAVATGVDTAAFKNLEGAEIRRQFEGKKLLISVGRLAEEKNFATLLRAFAVMETENAMLVVIGGGDEKKRLERLALELGIGSRVIFTGVLPFAEVKKHLAAADLFCFASITETQGLVTLEAMAAGVPVVAVEASGTRDAVEDGVQGYLTENDPAALASAMDHLLAHPELRAEMAAAGPHRAAQFDIARQTEKLVEVYRRAAEAQAAGRLIKVDTTLPLFAKPWKKYLRGAEQTQE